MIRTCSPGTFKICGEMKSRLLIRTCSLLELRLVLVDGKRIGSPCTVTRDRATRSLTNPCCHVVTKGWGKLGEKISTRWKELLSLKRFYRNSNKQQEHQKSNPSSSSTNTYRSLKQFIHRSSKSSVASPEDSSLILPLMKDTDTESNSLSSSRLSLSSSCSSSNHEHEDLPRLSLDSDKPNSHRSSNPGNRSWWSRDPHRMDQRWFL